MATLTTSFVPSISYSHIRNNSLNNSSAKMQYTFCKSRRFGSENRLKTEPPFYDVPNINKQRSTTFGVGGKLKFEDRRVIPASNTYTLNSDFSPEKGKKRGFSFGIGRQSIKAKFMNCSDAPGPGTYNPQIKPHPLSALMMGKVKDHSLDQKMKVPGPGKYNQPLLTETGRTIQSKHSNSRLPVILKGERIKVTKSQTPSPWTYQIKSLTPSKQLSSSRFGKFSTSKKLAVYKINETPGPGFYNRFSEFPS